jgi:hypothetical protein
MEREVVVGGSSFDTSAKDNNERSAVQWLQVSKVRK